MDGGGDGCLLVADAKAVQAPVADLAAERVDCPVLLRVQRYGVDVAVDEEPRTVSVTGDADRVAGVVDVDLVETTLLHRCDHEAHSGLLVAGHAGCHRQRPGERERRRGDVDNVSGGHGWANLPIEVGSSRTNGMNAQVPLSDFRGRTNSGCHCLTSLRYVMTSTPVTPGRYGTKL